MYDSFFEHQFNSSPPKLSPLGFTADETGCVSTRLNLVNLADPQILTIPGEALPNIGYYLKRKMHARYNLLFGLTNAAFGYILTKVDYNSFDRYDYITRASLGEILIEQGLKFLDSFPRPPVIPTEGKTKASRSGRIHSKLSWAKPRHLFK